MPAAAISLSIHSVLVLALTQFVPSPQIINNQRDEIYLVNLVAPKVEHIPLETVKRQRHSHFKPRLNPAGNLINTLTSRPLAINTIPSASRKRPFSPKPKTNLARPAAYERTIAQPLPQSQREEITLLYSNPLPTRAGLSTPPLLQKQARTLPNQRPTNELLTYQKAIRSKILAAKIYPPNALKRGQEGVICLRFLLSKDGGLKDVKLANASQYPLLNRAAINTIKQASPFQPLPASLKKNELWVKLAISFVLEK